MPREKAQANSDGPSSEVGRWKHFGLRWRVDGIRGFRGVPRRDLKLFGQCAEVVEELHSLCQ